ncbi:hypothetical protein TVAG_474060 [Trichomonas vaginalis G3]|uniref:Leucine Rich Repeat family protein n=1 Tax=Trichomonas vaginalis (strain ATCC PRA-98 / G3) TaxID=412133 RepID=A2EQ52_TRIV3|nr:ribonuclease inhibitor domain-containing protein [Trichomonas vaginalis G3]EAY05227.1 hypothetical protein TVAG_474060 [Trichomonas vaginalis G3]KAI5542606.1 ribonuclease inhibitor domain-containing protein [Trichomonas vaginalis G3]|eukprot:XP_001317450.1 hypothetical protein [Trichomonas vaginalis G3]
MQKKKFELKQRRSNDMNLSRVRYSVLIARYPQNTPLNTIINFIQSLVKSKTMSILDIRNLRTTPNGIAFSVPNDNQFKIVLSLNGSMISQTRLWITRYPDSVKKENHILDKIFQLNFSNNTMDLSDIFGKMCQISPKGHSFNITDQSHLEYLFFYLGSEALSKNIKIRALNLSKNYISIIDNLNNLLWFLPDLKTLDLSQNPINFLPNLNPEFSGINIIAPFGITRPFNQQNSGWQQPNQNFMNQNPFGFNLPMGYAPPPYANYQQNMYQPQMGFYQQPFPNQAQFNQYQPMMGSPQPSFQSSNQSFGKSGSWNGKSRSKHVNSNKGPKTVKVTVTVDPNNNPDDPNYVPIHEWGKPVDNSLQNQQNLVQPNLARRDSNDKPFDISGGYRRRP